MTAAPPLLEVLAKEEAAANNSLKNQGSVSHLEPTQVEENPHCRHSTPNTWGDGCRDSQRVILGIGIEDRDNYQRDVLGIGIIDSSPLGAIVIA